MMLGKAPGAQFEISVDGKPRSYRDRKAVVIEAAEASCQIIASFSQRGGLDPPDMCGWSGDPFRRGAGGALFCPTAPPDGLVRSLQIIHKYSWSHGTDAESPR